MTKENRDTVINLRVNSSLKKDLQRLADADRRKLSDYIHVQLEILVEKTKKK
jgi:mRNA-degrading endonuclease RelE of RelBE toxin-antitoxin system